MWYLRSSVLCAMTLLALPAVCSAESIYLKSGVRVDGEILEKSSEEIKVRLHGGFVNTYRMTDVDGVGQPGEKEIQEMPVTADDTTAPAETETFTPAPESTGGFPAILFNNNAASLGLFTAAGPDENSLQPVDRKLRHVVGDPQSGTYYALTSHDLGALDPADLSFRKIEFGAGLKDVSWPSGLAYDRQRGRLLFTGSSGAGQDIFAYSPETETWETLSEDRHTGEGVIAYCSQSDSLYALPNHKGGNRTINELMKINSNGAVVKTQDLSRDILYFSGADSSLQMACYEEKLYVLVHQKPHPRLPSPALYVIDTATGATEMAPYTPTAGLLEQLWPGLPDGPGPSVEIAGVCASGPLSEYVTPADLVRKPEQELHVIAATYGDVNVWNELKRVKKLKIDAEGVEMAVDLSKTAAGVNVTVRKSARPLVLALYSPNMPYMPHSIVWNLEVEEGARLAKVIMVDNEHQKLIGLPDGVPVQKVPVAIDSYAHAWEIRENPRGEFDAMIRAIRKHSGLRESSFQGCSYGKSFTVPLLGE